MRTAKHLLLFVVDDLRPELACFGRAGVYTPNIDRLAARATRFTRAHCNFPQCMPSRASMMSGLRPSAFCSWSNELCTRGEPTLPGHLRAHGFKTVSCGKVYHEPLDDAFNWNELHQDTFRPRAPGQLEQSFHDYQLPENRRLTEQKFSLPFSRWIKEWPKLPPAFECADAPDDAYVDALVARRAIDAIERHRGDSRRLFLACGFYRPHLPWIAPKKYWDLYRREDIPLADNPFFPHDAVGCSDLCDFRHYGDAWIHERYSDIGRYDADNFPVLDPERQRDCVHAYRAAVSFMDAQLGRVLDAIDASGLADETAIVLWGDNGWHLGEHRLWSKVTHFDESTRVPLVVAAPGVTRGDASHALVEMVDVYPTVCDMLGLPKPAHLHGYSLPLSGEPVPADRAIGVVAWNGRTLLTERYRLTHYPHAGEKTTGSLFAGRGQWELFDLAVDPRENRNVARDPAYAEVLANLQARYRTHFAPV